MITTKNFRNSIIKEANEALSDTGTNVTLREGTWSSPNTIKEYTMDELKKRDPKLFGDAARQANWEMQEIDDQTAWKNLLMRSTKSREVMDLQDSIEENYPDDFSDSAFNAVHGGDDNEFDRLASSLKYEIDNLDLEGHSTDQADFEYNMEHVLDALVGGLRAEVEDHNENAFEDMYKELYAYGEKILTPKMKAFMSMEENLKEDNSNRYRVIQGQGLYDTGWWIVGPNGYASPAGQDFEKAKDEVDAANRNIRTNTSDPMMERLQKLSGVKR